MNQVLTIAAASVREHSRRKLIMFFVGASLILAAGLAYFTLRQGEGSPLALPVNLTANRFMGFLALIAALAVSMGNIGRPFADGEAAMLLARPVARWQYAAGRLLASVLVVGGLCALMVVELQAVRLLDGSGISSGLWGYWAVQWFNLTLIVSIATLLSVVIGNPVIVAVCTYFIDQLMSGISFLYRSAELGRIAGEASGVIKFLWYVTPKQLSSALFLRELGAGSAEARQVMEALVGNTATMALWATAYLAGIIALTMALVARKEL
ncbi:MAG: ABC transporter permease [Actinomycetota bacterium]